MKNFKLTIVDEDKKAFQLENTPFMLIYNLQDDIGTYTEMKFVTHSNIDLMKFASTLIHLLKEKGLLQRTIDFGEKYGYGGKLTDIESVATITPLRDKENDEN